MNTTEAITSNRNRNLTMSNPTMTTERSILIVDNQDAFTDGLARSFKGLGFQVTFCTRAQEVREKVATTLPALIVSEVRMEAQWAFDLVESLGSVPCPIVIVTAYPSVATAVQSLRRGVSGYVAKPVDVHTILQLAGLETAAEADAQIESSEWPSLDRTIWEYINQVLASAGSIAEAARRLRVDRRSLKRMLAKYPPSR
jgi:two-component system response regulator RegA